MTEALSNETDVQTPRDIARSLETKESIVGLLQTWISRICEDLGVQAGPPFSEEADDDEGGACGRATGLGFPAALRCPVLQCLRSGQQARAIVESLIRFSSCLVKAAMMSMSLFFSSRGACLAWLVESVLSLSSAWRWS